MERKNRSSEYKQYLKVIGIRIRLIREQKKLSQEKLSFEAGIHRTYLSDLELGNRNPSIGTLYLIAKALNVDLIDIISVEDHEEIT
jgi:transcriptional regulator with XRE-family HTH domain